MPTLNYMHQTSRAISLETRQPKDESRKLTECQPTVPPCHIKNTLISLQGIKKVHQTEGLGVQALVVPPPQSREWIIDSRRCRVSLLLSLTLRIRPITVWGLNRAANLSRSWHRQ